MEALGTLTLDDYLARLASGDAVPGGGAAVAITAAQAVALLSMALHISSKGTMNTADNELVAKLGKARARFLDLATEDGVVFGGVMACYKLPNKSNTEKTVRKTHLQVALKGAAGVPLEVLTELKTLYPIMETIADHAKPSIASDVALAVQLVDAAVKGACYNVRINLKYLEDAAFRDHTENTLATLTDGRRELRKALIKKLTAHF